VAILTEERFVQPAPAGWWQAQAIHEDELLLAALAALGLRTRRVAWSDSAMDWSRTQAAVFRSTWDYVERFADFSSWVTRAGRSTRLVNSAALVRWNWDKRYLVALAHAGIAIPATRFLAAGAPADLDGILRACGWREAILKPAVSGGARHTYRIDAASAPAHQEVFSTLLAREAMLVQEFLPSVPLTGEVSLMVIGGVVTHAVRKRAKAGDFRVQDDHGGTVAPHDPDPGETAFAERVVAACPTPPAYARVDLVRDQDGGLALMELELIEPELFLRFNPPAAAALARAIAEALTEPAGAPAG
jgi:glutathione synthase/RimK-type ligase-like ATP-grasp enzyme